MIVSSLMCCIFLNALFSVALAGPEGAQVVNGQVTFQQSGYNTTITASDKAIINYSSFDITRPEVVQFIQPNSNASVLNRIQSENPTNINGTLLANGRVFFVNPAGVYIGASAKVNVNQLVASSLNITNSDFINGRFNFEGGNGSVINDGDITAEKVYLIGKQVANSGSIHCPAGCVVMAAGNRVFLSEPDSEIVLEIDPQTLPEQTDPAESRPGVLNEGTVDAAGGKIVLAAGDIYAQAISNVGSLSASVEIGKAGQVKLTADGGQITNTGTIEATGSEGGTVAMEGARIEQFGTVHADGTDSHGGSVGLLAEDAAALGSDSLTTANAGTNGDGGEIIVYSPDNVLFHNGATIEAKGGSESGDGGFVEVSGKKHVEIFGQADASSTNGAAGTFVIDPADITIAAAPEVEDIGDDGDGTFTSNADTNIILDTTIEGYLDSGTNVTLDTSDYDASGPHAGPGGGDITVSAAIDPSAGLDNGDVTLTLNAADDITVNAAIDGSGLGTNSKLNVELHANRVVANPTDDGNTSSGNVGIHDTITTNGGSFTSSGIDFDNTGGTISTNGGNVDIQNTGDVTIGAAINTGAGDVDIDGGSSVARNIISSGGIITCSGVINLEASGNIGASGAAIRTSSTGTINASSTVAGDIYINNTGAVTLGTVSTAASDIIINNSGDLSVNSVTADGGGDVYLGSTGDITAQTISTTTGDIYVRSLADLILNGPVKSGGEIALRSIYGKIETQQLDATSGNIYAKSLIDLILSSPVTSGGEIALQSIYGKIETQKLDAISGNISVNSYFGDLILSGPVTSGDVITLESTEGKIVFNDSGPGPTPAITAGGAVSLAAGEIYSNGNNENAPLGIQGATELFLFDTGPGPIKLAEVGGSTISSTSITVGDTGYGTIDITYDNGKGWVDIDNHFIKSVAQPFSFFYTANKGGINIGSITTATGDISVRSWANLILSGPVTSGGGITLESTEGKIVFYDSDPGLTPIITAGGTVHLAAGEIYSYVNNENSPLGIQGATGLTLNDTGPGDIKLAVVDGSTIGSTSVTVGDIGYGKIDITYDNGRGWVDIDDNHFINSVDQPFSFSYTANKGDINICSITTATGDITVKSIIGDLILYAPVRAEGGGVRLIAQEGKIYTPLPRGAKDTLNIPITGYCDDELGIGVDLPYGPGKAAIIIISNDDLTLGPGAILTACGIYQAVVNDRQGVGLISTGKDPGIPIDVAIYVNSQGYVTVDSAVSIYPGGAMVIDTWDKVNDFGHDFKNSWTYNAGRNRLELVSRQILHEGEAVKLWTLPYAEEAMQGRAPPWFKGSAYGIEAYGIELGSGRVESISSSRLAAAAGLPRSPPFPRMLILETPSGSVKGPNEEELMRWLEQEGIAPYFEGAYQETLNTDLRFVKAANQLRDYAATMNSTTNAQIEELTEMLDGIVQPGPIALPIAWFDRQLRVNRQRDEVLYADVGGKWIDALIGFTNILNTQFGWPIDNCIKKVMRDYIVKLKADDHRFFVQKYILSVLGVEDRPIFLATLEAVD